MDWREIYKKKKNGGSVQSSAPATGTTSSVASSGSDWKSIYQSKMRSIASGEMAAPDIRGVKTDVITSSRTTTQRNLSDWLNYDTKKASNRLTGLNSKLKNLTSSSVGVSAFGAGGGNTMSKTANARKDLQAQIKALTTEINTAKQYQAEAEAVKNEDRLLKYNVDDAQKRLTEMKNSYAASYSAADNVRALGATPNVSHAQKELRSQIKDLSDELERARSVQYDKKGSDTLDKLKTDSPAAWGAVDVLASDNAVDDIRALGAYSGVANRNTDQARMKLKAMGYEDKDIEQLVDYRKRQLNKERYVTAIQQAQEMANDGFGGAVAASADSVARRLWSVLGTINIALQHLRKDDRPIDYYTGSMALAAVADAERAQVSQNIIDSVDNTGLGESLAFLYQTGMSMADSAVAMLATGAMGATAGAGATATKAAKMAGLMLMGGGASTTAITAAKERGLSDKQALALGLCAGAAEVITEKIGVDQFLDTISTGSKRALVEIGKNALAEGSEEVGSEFLNLFADIAISGDKSEWEQSIRAYKELGYGDNEALSLAVADKAKEIGVSFLGGVLSGGVFGTAGVAVNRLQNNDLRVKVTAATMMDEDTQSYRIAQQIQELVTADVPQETTDNLLAVLTDSLDKHMRSELSASERDGLMKTAKSALKAQKMFDKASKQMTGKGTKQTEASEQRSEMATAPVETESAAKAVEQETTAPVRTEDPPLLVAAIKAPAGPSGLASDKQVKTIIADRASVEALGLTYGDGKVLQGMTKSQSRKAVRNALTNYTLTETIAKTEKAVKTVDKSAGEVYNENNKVQTGGERLSFERFSELFRERFTDATDAEIRENYQEHKARVEAETAAETTEAPAAEQTAQTETVPEQEGFTSYEQFSKEFREDEHFKDYSEEEMQRMYQLTKEWNKRRESKVFLSDIGRVVSLSEFRQFAKQAEKQDGTEYTEEEILGAFDAAVESTKADVERHEADRKANLDTMAQNIKSAFEARKLGIDVEVVYGENEYFQAKGTRENAVVVGNKIVFNGNVINSGEAMLYVLGHELVHPGARVDKELVDTIIKTFQYLADNGIIKGNLAKRVKNLEETIENTRQLYQQHEDELAAKENREAVEQTTDKVREEVAADLMREAFASTEICKEIVGYKPGLANKVKDAIRRVKNAITGADGKLNPEAQQKLDELNQRFDDALKLVAEKNSRFNDDNVEGKVDSGAEPGVPNPSRPQFSLSTWEQPNYKSQFTTKQFKRGLAKEGKNFVYKTGHDVLADLLDKEGVDADVADRVLTWMDGMADFMRKAEVKYQFINLAEVNNAKVSVRYDTSGKPLSIALSAMVKNGEYPVNFDLTQICKRREAMSKFVNKLLDEHQFSEFSLSKANLLEIVKILRDEGYDTACTGCFVESKRYYMEDFTKRFVKKWNDAVKKINPNAEYFNFADANREITREEIEAADEAMEAFRTANAETSADKTESLEEVVSRIHESGLSEEDIEAIRESNRAGHEAVDADLAAGKQAKFNSNKYVADKTLKKYTEPRMVTETELKYLIKRGVFGGKKANNAEQIENLVKSDPVFQRLLTGADIMTTGGLTQFTQLSDTLVSLLSGSYGSGAPKLAQGFIPYNNEIAFLPDKVGKINLSEYLQGIAGLRSQSFSDFKIENVFDYFQMAAELTARHLPAHMYTKELACAKILGMLGVKVNMSVMFNIEGDEYWGSEEEARKYAGLIRDKDGNITYNYADKANSDRVFEETGKRPFIQSIDVAGAFELQDDPRYSKNVGVIGVGYGDEHIRVMLNDPRFRYIIPYHSSSLPVEIKNGTNLNRATDYTGTQNTLSFKVLKPDGKGVSMRGKSFKSSAEFLSWVEENGYTLETKKAQAGHGEFDLYGDLEKTNDPKQTAENYKAWCWEHGYLPLFYQFSSEENYYKLLYDFSVYDHEGNYAPQDAVQMWNEDGKMTGFPDDIMGVVETEMKAQNSVNEELWNPEKVEHVVDTIYNTVKLDKGEEQTFTEGASSVSTVAPELSVDPESGDAVAYSLSVTDKETLDFLNKQIEDGDYITVYRSFQVIDGGLYAPMNAVDRDANGKNKRLGYRSQIGKWEMATESPEIAQRYMDSHPGAKYAKFDLDSVDNKTGGVAYNPYLHASNLVLNDQFTAAYRRNLVTVECRVPLSEANGAYKAQYAKDATGFVEWKPGGVAGKLMKVKPEYTRKLFVSRYMMPVRIMPESEVAQMYKEYLDGTDISVNWNVVTPKLRTELEKAGVSVSYNDVKFGGKVVKFQDVFGGQSGESRARYSIETVDSETMVVIRGESIPGDALIARSYLNAVAGGNLPLSKILADGARPIYLGLDLPGEYTASKSTRELDDETRRAKMNAAGVLDEMILLADEPLGITNAKDKHKTDAKFGWNQYHTTFAIATTRYDGKAERLTVYDGELLIRNDADGRAYLYDVVNIKKRKTITRATPNVSSARSNLTTDKGSTYGANKTTGKQVISSNGQYTTDSGKVNKNFSLSPADDMVEYNSTALWKESTIDKYLHDYAAKMSPNYAQAYVAWMSPKQFLDLTTSISGRHRVVQESHNLDVDEFTDASLYQPIQLAIDSETGDVVGHEGRHRMVALSNAGIDKVPVLLFDSSNKYSKTHMDEMILGGQDFGSSRSLAVHGLTDVMPFNYANRDAIIEKFSTKTSLMKMGEKYAGKTTLQYSVEDDELKSFLDAYDEAFGEGASKADFTSLTQQLRAARRARRTAEMAEESKQAKISLSNRGRLATERAWEIYHKRTVRTVRNEYRAKLEQARKGKIAAVKQAVVVERAKAEVKLEEQELAERMNAKKQAAKRLGLKDEQIQQMKNKSKEKSQLQRNASRNTLKNKRLADKKRAAIETEQGMVNTLRENPKQRTFVEKLQSAAEDLRVKGRSFYKNFVNKAVHIDLVAKRQTSNMTASTLVTVVGSTGSTVESLYTRGLVDRSGNIIGKSMKEVFLCDDGKGHVDYDKQALLQDYMLHLHNVDRMSFVSNARTKLESFEQANQWLAEMDKNEFARLVAMTDKEIEKSGKQQAHDLAMQYSQLLQEYSEATDKPVFPDENGNPVTAETSRQIVAKYEAENAWLVEKAQSIYDWWDQFMKTWVVGGSITQEQYDTMREMYPHYVPTYRVDGKGLSGAVSIGAKGAKPGQVVKSAKGGLSEIVNIEDSFANLAAKAVKSARVNELYKNLVDTALLDGDGVFEDYMLFDWDSVKQGASYATQTGEVVSVYGNGFDVGESVDAAEAPGLVKTKDGYKVSAWYNGRLLSTYVSEDLFTSLQETTGAVKDKLDKVAKVGSVLTNPMKTAITGINPNFALRNPLRDVPTAVINSVSGLAFPKYLARAWKEIYRSDAWHNFVALGGTNSLYYNTEGGFGKAMGVERGAAGTVKKVWNGTKNVMGFLNETTESVTRFAEYLATIDRMGDTYENRLIGIKNAAEVTVDFSRKGSYGAAINAWVPYWNPAVQGIDKVFRSVFDAPNGKKAFAHGMATLGRAVMTTVLLEAIQQVILAVLGRRDDWEELNDRTKDTYYCIPTKDHKFIKIPKNREWGAILGTPLMRLFEGFTGRDDPFENFLETSIIPNFLPGGPTDIIGISQYIDLATNKDFAGRSIVPYAYTQGSLAGQYDDKTSEMAKLFSKLLGEKLGPMQVDYIIQDYFGDFGDIATMLTAKSTWGEDESVKGILESLWKTVESPWVTDNRYSNADVSVYYENIDELERTWNDKKNHGDGESYKDSIEYKTFQAIVYKSYGKEISEINKQIKDLPDGEKKDDLKDQIAKLAGQANEFIDKCLSGDIEAPDLVFEYENLPVQVSDELIRLRSLSDEYSFKPSPSSSKSYVDPTSKVGNKAATREYVLDDEAKAQYNSIYEDTYSKTMQATINSYEYRKANDTHKAEMLEDARDTVAPAVKEEFMLWLQRNRKPTQRKK